MARRGGANATTSISLRSITSATTAPTASVCPGTTRSGPSTPLIGAAQLVVGEVQFQHTQIGLQRLFLRRDRPLLGLGNLLGNPGLFNLDLRHEVRCPRGIQLRQPLEIQRGQLMRQIGRACALVSSPSVAATLSLLARGRRGHRVVQ